MNPVDRLDAGIAALRRRYGPVDHLFRAAVRYDEVNGTRLAAAIAYYGFFAAFALGVLLFAVIGFVLRDNPTVTKAVRQYLQANLPQVTVTTLVDNSQHIGWIALVGLGLAGVGWVESLRSSQRAIWGLDQHPGHWLIRWLVDLAVLVGLGILLLVSVAISAGAQDLLFRLAGQVGPSPLRVTLNESTTLLAGVVDLVLAAALLAGVPRLRLPLRRLAPSALLVAVGLLLLKTVGRWYVGRTLHNPAYQVVAGAVGLLIFMYLFNQFVLFAAALAATSGYGTVVDLAAGPPAPPPPEPAAVPAAPHAEEISEKKG